MRCFFCNRRAVGHLKVCRVCRLNGLKVKDYKDYRTGRIRGPPKTSKRKEQVEDLIDVLPNITFDGWRIRFYIKKTFSAARKQWERLMKVAKQEGIKYNRTLRVWV